jgi:hypothetical protein
MRSRDVPGTVHASDFKAQALPNLYFIVFKDGLAAQQFEIRVTFSSRCKASSCQIYGESDYFFWAIPCLP